MLPSIIVEFRVYLSAQDINDSRMESDVDRISDHANRRKSITKQDVSSTARARRKKERKKKCDALSALSPCLCASILFLHRIACQPMDLLVSNKFVLSQIDVLSFNDCPLIPHAPFLPLQSAPRLLSLA